MILQKARMSEFKSICAFYQTVTEGMEKSGLRQWHWGRFPSEDMVRRHIENGAMYRTYDADGVAVAVAIDREGDETYSQINWIFGVRPAMFHMLAVRADMRGKGLAAQALDDVEELARRMGCDSLRCDTYTENSAALMLYAHRGLRTAGRVIMRDRPKPFICCEKPLTATCPFLPIVMHPAFRGGSLTPWGGDKLLKVYDKPITDIPTGESLEISCIPNLESTDNNGTRLTDIIKRYGQQVAGKYAFQPFPLLLKLIDAREPLSVQVHPNDEYANANEHGKLGKTEAWLILDAPEGSELVYGIQPGTTREQLQAACEQGAAVEPLLRRVKVKPGDVCFIPAGCVHAIGAGIMLYEIQQSSDVTYRFYDWDRVDKNGNRRELHLKKALDVTDLSFSLDPVPAPDAPVARVLDEKFFTLDLMKVDGTANVPAVHEFGMLTALDSDLTLCWEGSSLPMKKGDSVYLPTLCPALWLQGQGRAALSMPR